MASLECNCLTGVGGLNPLSLIITYSIYKCNGIGGPNLPLHGKSPGTGVLGPYSGFARSSFGQI